MKRYRRSLCLTGLAALVTLALRLASLTRDSALIGLLAILGGMATGWSLSRSDEIRHEEGLG